MGIAEQIRALEEEQEQLEQLFPIAFARLWDPLCIECAGQLEQVAPSVYRCQVCDITEPRTSQRQSLSNLLSVDVERGFLTGGNRTGKSEGCAQLACIVALGSANPQAKHWARINGIDISSIQPGPGIVWAIALTSNDSIRYVRPKVAKYAPKGSAWHNRNGKGEATVTFPNGGLIVFKNVKQGEGGFQGDAIHLAWFDEEPTLHVVTETDYRLADYDNRHTDPRLGCTRMIFSMTPLKGWTQLLRLNLRGSIDANSGSPLPGVRRERLEGTDNPHVSREALESRYAKTSAHERRARQSGEITALEGRIYTDFDPAVHVIKPFPIPEDWERFEALDFGFTNPFCLVWGAMSPDGTLYIIREHYKAGWLLKRHMLAYYRAVSCPECFEGEGFGPMDTHEDWWERYAAGCESCSGTGRIEPSPDYRWADPENAENRRSMSQDYDLPTSPAYKPVTHGITKTAERLIIQKNGRSRLYIFDCCPNLITEFGSYRWKPNRTGAEPKPLKQNDHGMDAVRYLVTGLDRIGL